ncbi:hypothetical protein [Embleya sp. AB8]|uniref:hypothetical protein n=1 Tax=Embleya sp. AB8 TaxID=3156304 RepID=UPI003C743CF4
MTIRFATVNPNTPLVRDKATGVIAVPPFIHDEHGEPTEATDLLLNPGHAELLYAGLSRALSGKDPKGRTP